MHVKMKHGLAGDAAIVGKDVESLQAERINERSGNELGRVHDIRQFIPWYRKQICAVSPWNNQRVPEVDGMDVKKSDHSWSLIEDFRRLFFADDSAKKALRWRVAWHYRQYLNLLDASWRP